MSEPPPWLNALIWFSLIVSSLGLLLGLLLILTTEPMIDFANLEFDSREWYEAQINNILRLFANILIIVSPYTLITSLLSKRGVKVAWFMFLIPFIIGAISSLYLMYQVIEVMFLYQLFTFPIIPILLIGVSAIGLVILLRSDTKQFYAGNFNIN